MMNLLKSSRFQGILLIAILQALVVFNVITGDQATQLITIIQAVAAGAITVRTVDRFGDKKVEAAEVAVDTK